MTTTIADTRGRRSARTALTGFLAAAAVAGGLAATPPSATAQALAATITGEVELRPDGDVARFAVTRSGASAASVLDDRVTSRSSVPAGDAIRASAESASTTVTLGGKIRATLRPTGGRAWFFAGTRGSGPLRVEVVSQDGGVLARTTVGAGKALRWGSVAFPAASRAAVKGLSLRFIATGAEGAEVRAAYASITSRTGRAATLRPLRDVSGFAVEPSGTAAAALDDEVRAPSEPSYADRLRAGAANRSTTVTLADVPVPDGMDGVTAWYHAGTGAGTRLRVEAVSDGQVRGTSTLAAASPADWYSFTVPVTGQAATDDLQLRFTSVGGGDADVAAAQVVGTGHDASPSFRDVLNDYAASLTPLRAGPAEPAKPTGAPVQTVSEPLADIDAPSGASRFECTTTPVYAASNPSKIVTLDPDGNKMWLGALLQGQGYAGGPGSLADLPTTGKRAPVKIWMDLMGADIKRTVEDPDGGEVQQAIADLVRTAQDSGVTPAARISYEETSQSNVEEGLVKAGISVRYMGGNGSADLKSQRSAHRSSLLVSLTQRSFTVNLVRPNTFADYFDERFTPGDLETMQAAGQIAPDNPPVVISNIAYGRVLYYSLSSTASQEELEVAVKASYALGEDGGSGELTVRQQQILNQAEVKVFAMGGSAEGVESLIRTHKMQDYFAAGNPLSSAVPISYQVDNLDGSAATFTEKLNYDLRTCRAIPNEAIDIGDVIRIEKPQFYLDSSRTEADMYGSLSVNGVEFWHRTRDQAQKVRNHVVTNPTSTDPAVDRRVTWPLEVTLHNDTNPLARIQGSVNCRLAWYEIGDDPSNQYHWIYDVRSSQPRYMQVPGGSASCGTQLRFQVDKVSDVWKYQP